MKDYVNLTEIGNFKNLIDDMPVRIWDTYAFAKVCPSYKEPGLSSSDIRYFFWTQNHKSGLVGFVECLHLNQIWIESGWIFTILK